MSLLQKIEQLQSESQTEIQSLQSEEQAKDLKIKYLGKKGLLTEILKGVGAADPSERPKIGQATNQFKTFFEEAIEKFLSVKKKEALQKEIEQTKIDITLPGRETSAGSVHPITQMLEEIRTFFLRLGFDVHGGPEIETDFYNFEALGIPPNHPARDMQDTFYVESDSAGRTQGSPLLRTHTSPVQIHVMEKMKPPIRMIAPGAVYRRDSDVSHTPMFHQIEGLVVDQNISFKHLKGMMTLFLQEIFDKSLKVQFRPSYFPFTEPSAEIDIQCVICKGDGCRVCKQTGWLEVAGCGMVDPVVFQHVKYDPEIYTGFAFGMGIERLAMLKFGINDIRLFFENDLRFLRQFG